MILIPAIDVISGQCVRLSQGDYAQQKTYYKDPLDAAKQFEDCGLKRVHIVDLDGAKASEPRNLAVLERIATHTALEHQYGGGIKSEDAIKSVFNAGAARAICGSIAAKEPEKFVSWLRDFTPERIILGADFKDGKIATHGWLQKSELTVSQLIEKFIPASLSQTICTDISVDGMLCGPNIDFYKELQESYPTVNITVSGGISCLDDLWRLQDAGLKSVIIGKAFYEGRITPEMLRDFS